VKYMTLTICLRLDSGIFTSWIWTEMFSKCVFVSIVLIVKKAVDIEPKDGSVSSLTTESHVNGFNHYNHSQA